MSHSTRPGSSLDAEIEALAPWFHNLHLPDGQQTAPAHRLGDFPNRVWQQIAPHIPSDLSGWTVLDLGCNAGFYSLELARRGAQVTAIDIDPHYLRQARWAAAQCNLEERITFRLGQIYELGRESETFDLVWFMGVFYHLRYPQLGLDIAARKTRRLLVFQSLSMPGDERIRPPGDVGLDERQQLLQPGWPMMAFVEHRLANDPTNWWAPNHACMEALLRSAGMGIKQQLLHETYLCQPEHGADGAVPREMLDAEYHAVLGG